MSSSNVIQRTFHIKWETSTKTFTGTAFAIDHVSKQYLVTARHVVDGIESGNAIKLFHEGKWNDLSVNVVGIGKGEIDIAVLACSTRLAPSLPLVASSEDLTYGQSVFFLGYPFGQDSGHEHINRGIPVPYVKAGIVSAMESGDVAKIYLDAHGNKGFSGGPVVFVPNKQPGNRFRVAGVISCLFPCSQWTWQERVARMGRSVVNSEGQTIGYVVENPGIVTAFHIHHVVELIDANPIGFPLPAEQQEGTHGRKV